MLRLTLIALLVAVAIAMEWEEYKIAYQKTYEPWEEASRRAIYQENLAKINRHNAEANKGLHTYRLGVNKFADMTSEEINTQMNGLKMPKKAKSAPVFMAPPSTTGLPDSLDWRRKGWVTPIKNQGYCGSCWAFSATGAMEGQHFNKTGKLVSLSEQQLVDCSWDEGNKGCDGGLMDSAFEYVIKNHGIDTEAAYPYEDKQSDKCRFNKSAVGATISSYVNVQSFSEAALQQAVVTVGPIAVAIDAKDPDFHYYSGGIYASFFCNAYALNHGVLVVGYGTMNNIDYWLVKNSWGTDWGIRGYFMIARNAHNMCGIATAGNFPLV